MYRTTSSRSLSISATILSTTLVVVRVTVLVFVVILRAYIKGCQQREPQTTHAARDEAQCPVSAATSNACLSWYRRYVMNRVFPDCFLATR